MDTFNTMSQPSTHFWRDNSDRPNVSSEHTLFTSGERLTELFDKLSRKVTADDFDNGLRFTAETAPAGDPAGTVRVPFTSNKSTYFTYDQEDMLYYMEQYNAPFIDGATGEQLAVTNILILRTSVSVIPGDPEGRRQVALTGSGGGFYIAEGKYIPITWSREAHDAPFRYALSGGGQLELRPGKTYVCIIGNNMEPVFE
jgi:hypothetical protein